MNTVAIQAGGRSSRMGRDKALVELGGKKLIEHVLEKVRDLTENTLITTNSPEDYLYLGVPLASDEDPGAGALPGLRTALLAAPGDLVLLVACDMPFLNVRLLHYLLEIAGEADVVVPIWDGRHQTMHAVYRRDPCLAAVEAALADGEKRMISFYKDVRVREVSPGEITRFDPAGHSFFNVNNPEDLAMAEGILAG